MKFHEKAKLQFISKIELYAMEKIQLHFDVKRKLSLGE